jgi:hypothetical protein
MGLLVRLLNWSPKLFRMFRDFSIGFAAWTHTDLDGIKKWFESPPTVQQEMLREQPALSKEIEALFVEFERQMDTQYEVSALRREMLTLPALPEEGY